MDIGRGSDKISIPGNYGGSTFSEKDLFEKIAPEQKDEKSRKEKECTEHEDEKSCSQKDPPPDEGTLLPCSCPSTNTKNTLLGDLGLEELILIGLILLLSQNDCDNDIVFILLFLLLFK